MSRVNLLPPEYLEGRRANAQVRRIRRYAYLGVAILALAYAGRTGQIIYLDREIDAVRAEQATVQEALDALAEVAAARDAGIAAATISRDVLRGEVAWSEQLIAVGRTIPPGMVLTSLTGQITPGDTSGVIGSMTFSARSAQLPATPVLLTRIGAEEGWANGWISSVSGADGGIGVNGSWDLTDAAITEMGGGPA